MKKLILAVLAVISFAVFFTIGASYTVNGGQGVAFAADELKATGTVESVDAEKGELAITLKGSDETLTLSAGAEELKGLKKDDKVKVRYTAGEKNTATYIRKIGPILPPTGC